MKRFTILIFALICILLTVTASASDDVNGDGELDLKDVTALRRYLAGGYNVAVAEDALDVNDDGEVDLKDVTCLRRGLAGGYGIELDYPMAFGVLEKVELSGNDYYATLLVAKDDSVSALRLKLSASAGERLYNEYGSETIYSLVAYLRHGDECDVIVGDVSDSNYMRIPAGTVIDYNYKTTLFTIQEYGIFFMVNDSANLYYKHTVGTGEGLTKVGCYSRSALPYDYTYSIKTCGDTYLFINESGRRFLVATLLDGKITEPHSYDNMTPVLYAPESSFVELIGGKMYNSYVFMNNSTITNNAPITNLDLEYNVIYNNGIDGGALYIYNYSTLVYDQVTYDSELDYVVAGDILDVMTDEGIIECSNSDDSFWRVTDDIPIWGLKDANRIDTYSVITLEELSEMLKLVKNHNSTEGDDLAVRALFLRSMDKNGYLNLSSIIVEIFKKDGQGKAYSVNDTIFRSYYKK